MRIMKKILSVITAGLLLLSAVSCLKEEERITLNPSKGVNPVLVSSDTEEEIVVEYTPAQFYYGNDAVNRKLVYHGLILTSLNGKKLDVNLGAKDDTTTNTLTLKAKTFMTLMSASVYGLEDGQQCTAEFLVRGSVSSTLNGGCLDSEATIPYSFEFHLPQGSPYEGYDEDSPWGVTGAIAAYGISWDKDLNMWTDGTNHVAAHVTLKAGDELKFRKDQAWDVNMGGDMVSVGAEFSVTQGGANIKIEKDGVYDLFLNPTDGTAIVAEAYDPYPEYTEVSVWSVIGGLSLYGSSWDKDFAMMTDGTTSVAFAIQLDEADEYKYRKDADWGVNLGGEFGGIGNEFEVTGGGANIKVGVKGVYDLFVTPDQNIAWVTEACGLKISSIIVVPEPEEPKPEAWSIIGTVGGSNWDKDIELENTTDDIWVVRSIAMTEGDEFLVRADHDWATKAGGPEANATSTLDAGNPYDVYSPELGVAFEYGDNNIRIPKTGHFDITLNYADKTLLIAEHVAAFALIGKINGDDWKTDVLMTEGEGGVWTSPVVSVDGGFKIRYDYSWADENCYGVSEGFTPTIGAAFTAEQPGKDIIIAAGKYKVQFTPATKEVLITEVKFPEQLYMIGEEFGNWTWSSDGVVKLTRVIHALPDSDAEGQFYAIRYFTAGKTFKFNSALGWNGDDFNALANNDGFTIDGGNCKVEESGVYLVHVDFKAEKLHMERAKVYGIGDVFGGWNEGVESNLFTEENGKLKIAAKAGGIPRMYVSSSIATSPWWSREFVVKEGKILYREGDEIHSDCEKVQAAQTIVLDFNTGTGSFEGEGEAPKYKEEIAVPGSYSGHQWGNDGDKNPHLMGANGVYQGLLTMYGTGINFKFVHDGSWIGGTTEDQKAYTLSGDANMSIAEGAYFWKVDLPNEKAQALKVTKVTVLGSFSNWDANEVEMTYDATNYTYSASVTLEANAQVKVRFNSSWDYNLGGDKEKLTFNGDNITVADAGTYTVTLDVNGEYPKLTFAK